MVIVNDLIDKILKHFDITTSVKSRKISLQFYENYERKIEQFYGLGLEQIRRIAIVKIIYWQNSIYHLIFSFGVIEAIDLCVLIPCIGLQEVNFHGDNRGFITCEELNIFLKEYLTNNVRKLRINQCWPYLSIQDACYLGMESACDDIGCNVKMDLNILSKFKNLKKLKINQDLIINRQIGYINKIKSFINSLIVSEKTKIAYEIRDIMRDTDLYIIHIEYHQNGLKEYHHEARYVIKDKVPNNYKISYWNDNLI